MVLSEADQCNGQSRTLAAELTQQQELSDSGLWVFRITLGLLDLTVT